MGIPEIKGVSTDQEFHRADLVVSNMDIFSTYDRLLENTKSRIYTSVVVLFIREEVY